MVSLGKLFNNGDRPRTIGLMEIVVEGRYVLGQKQVKLVSICDASPKRPWNVSERMEVPIIDAVRQ